MLPGSHLLSMVLGVQLQVGTTKDIKIARRYFMLPGSHLLSIVLGVQLCLWNFSMIF